MQARHLTASQSAVPDAPEHHHPIGACGARFMTFSRSVATLIPWGRVVNGFIITLIFLNAIAFAADTVPELAERYGWAVQGV